MCKCAPQHACWQAVHAPCTQNARGYYVSHDTTFVNPRPSGRLLQPRCRHCALHAALLNQQSVHRLHTRDTYGLRHVCLCALTANARGQRTTCTIARINTSKMAILPIPREATVPRRSRALDTCGMLHSPIGFARAWAEHSAMVRMLCGGSRCASRYSWIQAVGAQRHSCVEAGPSHRPSSAHWTVAVAASRPRVEDRLRWSCLHLYLYCRHLGFHHCWVA